EAPPPREGGFGGPGAGGPGAGLRLLDRDGDGKITRAEYDAPFAQLDANRDGFVDATERAAAPQGGARLARLDRDGDGKITRAEYETPFDRLDANKDGVIDASELAAVRGRFGGRFGGRRGGFAPPPPAEGE
ncbi:MAG: hypothetical protein K2X76_07595, partial [Sphingomonas sp.]|nr:hypothetical protein [Sphingomonas sp.]